MPEIMTKYHEKTEEKESALLKTDAQIMTDKVMFFRVSRKLRKYFLKGGNAIKMH